MWHAALRPVPQIALFRYRSVGEDGTDAAAKVQYAGTIRFD
ncbi:hypothetical protein [Azospirillum endophyticum]